MTVNIILLNDSEDYFILKDDLKYEYQNRKATYFDRVSPQFTLVIK